MIISIGAMGERAGGVIKVCGIVGESCNEKAKSFEIALAIVGRMDIPHSNGPLVYLEFDTYDLRDLRLQIAKLDASIAKLESDGGVDATNP
jgi:hypothetical protein